MMLALPALPAVAQVGGAPSPESRACLAGLERLRFDPDGWGTDFCRHEAPLSEIRSGGPPRDGIPPIDRPRFESVAEAGAWLEDREPVIFFEHRGDARAYPIQILTWHEIVNDVVADAPVVVTFCPLCNAAIVFERPEVDGSTLTFGTSGNLRQSDLVMWDRQTESWWQQFSGEAIVGRLSGMELKMLPASMLAWRTFRELHPGGRVLSRDTGFSRPYGRNPYVGYDDIDENPLLFDGPVAEGMPAMARVVGVALGDEARAYQTRMLAEVAVLNDDLSGTPIVVFFEPGTSSALDAQRIAEGRDVGTAAVYRRRIDGRTLTFERRADGVVADRETASRWNILGRAVSGPLAGRRLDPVVYHEVFWFVWSAFKPNTTVHGVRFLSRE